MQIRHVHPGKSYSDCSMARGQLLPGPAAARTIPKSGIDCLAIIEVLHGPIIGVSFRF